MAHALLAPSSADVWSQCPGSVVLRSMVAETNTPESEEGTAAHWVAEQLLRDAVENERVSAASFEHLLGNAAPNGVLITREMLSGAKMYVDYVHSLDIDFSNYNIEQMVTCFAIHLECWGTPDFFGVAIKVADRKPILHVVDFKFGHGEVEVFENKQMLCYYSGIMDHLEIGDMDLTVVFHLVQPRCFHGNGPISTWEVEATELRAAVNQLSSAAHKAMGSAEVTSGNQCRHCPARHACEASRRAAVAAISYTNAATPDPLTDEALAYELPTLVNAIKALEYRKDALENEAVARMGAGRNIPNLSMKQAYGNRAWTAETDTVQFLAEMSGVSFYADPALVTPAEAERRLKAAGLSNKEATEALEGLVAKPSRGMKLSINTGDLARKAFS